MFAKNDPYRPEADEERVRQRFEEGARLALVPSEFATAAEDGRKMTPEQALQLAMATADAITGGDSLPPADCRPRLSSRTPTNSAKSLRVAEQHASQIQRFQRKNASCAIVVAMIQAHDHQ